MDDVINPSSDPAEQLKLENTDYRSTVQQVHATYAIVGVWSSGKSFVPP